MWHVDCHVMNDPRLKGLNLVVYFDDASRCVTGFGLFSNTTSENAVATLQLAIHRFRTPATILSDNGRCFVTPKHKLPTKKWQPTLFGNDLLERGIGLINSRPYHPQTNGKLEQFNKTIEDEIYHYDGLPEYIEYYNETRLYFSFDIDNEFESILQQKVNKSDQRRESTMDGGGR